MKRIRSIFCAFTFVAATLALSEFLVVGEERVKKYDVRFSGKLGVVGNATVNPNVDNQDDFRKYENENQLGESFKVYTTDEVNELVKAEAAKVRQELLAAITNIPLRVVAGDSGQLMKRELETKLREEIKSETDQLRKEIQDLKKQVAKAVSQIKAQN